MRTEGMEGKEGSCFWLVCRKREGEGQSQVCVVVCGFQNIKGRQAHTTHTKTDLDSAAAAAAVPLQIAALLLGGLVAAGELQAADGEQSEGAGDQEDDAGDTECLSRMGRRRLVGVRRLYTCSVDTHNKCRPPK